MRQTYLIFTLLLSCFLTDDSCGAEPALSNAIKAYLSVAGADTVKKDELSMVRGRVFAEFLMANEEDRLRSIRQLTEVYVAATELKERLAPYALLHRLPIDKGELAEAVADHLFDDDERTARVWARVLSDRLGSDSMSGYIDLRDIKDKGKPFLERETIRPVIRYLFQKSPSSALLLLARAQGPSREEGELLVKDRRITTHLLRLKYGPANSAEEVAETELILAGLAKSEHNWVRLYVAEMMVQNASLRNQETIGALADDKDELVVLAIRDLKNPRGQTRHRPIRTPWTPL